LTDVPVLRARIKEIAAARVRYGYTRIHVLLRREGWVVNRKRVYRIYREEGLSMRIKTPRRRKAVALRDRVPALASKQRPGFRYTPRLTVTRGLTSGATPPPLRRRQHAIHVRH
jgi:transposase InsO family protein